MKKTRRWNLKEKNDPKQNKLSLKELRQNFKD